MKKSLLTFAQVGRVSNLPSVWSNVLLGSLLYFSSLPVLPSHSLADNLLNLLADNWLQHFTFLLGCSAFYLFGMFANDWADAAWDKQNNPVRPIPSGKISRRQVGILAIGLLILGLGNTAFTTSPYYFNPWAFALLAAIVLYTLIHKRSRLGIIPMGLCRLLLVILGADHAQRLTYHTLTNLPAPLPWIPSAAAALAGLSLAIYVASLTLIARSEHLASVKRISPRNLVGWLLAGICLHDVIWFACCLPLPFLIIPIAGFTLCRLLQKFIPAT